MTGSVRVWLLLALLLAPVGTGGVAQAAGDPSQQFVIIVHPSNPANALTRQQVSEIFRKLATKWGGDVPVHPVDQASTSTTRRAFSRAVFGKDVSAVMSYWYHEIYSGRAVPPPQFADDNAVAAFVRDDPGAIGYVADGPLPDGVKGVRLLP